ncbi:MAG: membrane protein insertase YidC [Bacteroidota bacterium]|nr:membrane protein insertase YidC [Bacteroidota bacterium]MDP3145521.1 membrane protein insertase YidC [Bacteroidota bacterium]MDP3556481.1 membrane protein insertase YidC [Bacteroidota bacterium]
MDKNSLIGLGIIAAILGIWLYVSGPSKETLLRNKEIKDSIALVQQKAEAELIASQAITQKVADTIKEQVVLNDSAKTVLLNDQYRDFTPATKGKEEFFVIENENIKATILNKGAQIIKVELKKYQRSGQTEPLVLFDRDSLNFSLKLNAYDRSRIFSTDSFYFTSAKQTATSIDLKLETSKPGSYIEFSYSLKPNDYIVNSEIRFVGMESIISQTEDQLQLAWKMLYPSQEKYIKKEKQAATIYYKQTLNSPDYINPMKEEEKELNDADIKWVSFKQQYFNSTIIAENAFVKTGSFIKTSLRPNSTTIVKAVSSELGIPYSHLPNEKFAFKLYFGPNDYKVLKNYGYEMEYIVPTGWSIFSYINKWMIIPLFDALSFLNIGIVILILTLIVKILLLPIAYKTYMSGARMRVLKPETDALNAKFEKSPDPMKKQQEQMALYRKAGVNPLSGCFPLLLQFPILIALFAFLPAAIELRQQAFLWAEDLSTYDTIWNFGYVPFINWAYGDHVSLFALLMFVSTLVYTYMNSSMMPQQNNQMPGMKFMMYFMPVIFLAVMNDYAAGLSWYYFLANMFTFLQNWIMKKIISDSKIREQLEANMKKPAKVSNFQKKLADMAKQREQIGTKKK